MRPEFLRCVMTAGVIRRICEKQDYYDRDPEKAEREQREQMERRDEELRREQEQERENEQSG